jgi:hypothetical protein
LPAAFPPFGAPSINEIWVNVYNWRSVLERPVYTGKDAEFNMTDAAWDLITRYDVIMTSFLCSRGVRGEKSSCDGRGLGSSHGMMMSSDAIPLFTRLMRA